MPNNRLQRVRLTLSEEAAHKLFSEAEQTDTAPSLIVENIIEEALGARETRHKRQQPTN